MGGGGGGVELPAVVVLSVLRIIWYFLICDSTTENKPDQVNFILLISLLRGKLLLFKKLSTNELHFGNIFL